MKKIPIALLLLAVIGTAAYLQRIDIMLAAIKFKSSSADIAGPREVPWQQGPAMSPVEPGKRPPNIILIVADDLGYNDISTFGGGIGIGDDNGDGGGDGVRMQTPGIDRLAAEGVVFSQSYSGASTCAPYRAMMMTGRYPTRTGFEFTPTPNGMGSVVSSI
jgi:uncharacterized sulfatase